MRNPLDFEPVAVMAALRMIILAAMAFGLNWTVEQVTSIMLAVEAVLGLVTRRQVTSNNTLEVEAAGRAIGARRGS
jgi:uncharacterized protein (DUF697 family)